MMHPARMLQSHALPCWDTVYALSIADHRHTSRPPSADREALGANVDALEVEAATPASSAPWQGGRLCQYNLLRPHQLDHRIFFSSTAVAAYPCGADCALLSDRTWSTPEGLAKRHRALPSGGRLIISDVYWGREEPPPACPDRLAAGTCFRVVSLGQGQGDIAAAGSRRLRSAQQGSAWWPILAEKT